MDMRRVLFACAAVFLLAAQSAGPPRTVEAQAKLDKLLEGRVPGESRKCVNTAIVTNAIGIDDRTLLFKDGPRIWRTELRASFECGRLGRQSFIHTESAANRICIGDQLEFEDGNITGACVLGDFTPYTKAK
jgi:hypothetical protein